MRILVITVILLSATTQAALYPAIATTAMGVTLIGAGIGLFVVNQQAQAEFRQKHNSSTIWVTGFSGAQKECIEDIPDGNGGDNEVSYPYTGYAKGEYLAYVNRSLATFNGILDYECGDTLDSAIHQVQKFYKVRDHFGIWYEESNPNKFYMKDGGSPITYGKLGVLSLCFGAPLTLFGIAWLAYQNNACKRWSYQQVVTSDVEIQ